MAPTHPRPVGKRVRQRADAAHTRRAGASAFGRVASSDAPKRSARGRRGLRAANFATGGATLGLGSAMLLLAAGLASAGDPEPEAQRRQPAGRQITGAGAAGHRVVIQDFLPEIATSKAARLARPSIHALKMADLFEPAPKRAAAVTTEVCNAAAAGGGKAEPADCAREPIILGSWAPPDFSVAVDLVGEAGIKYRLFCEGRFNQYNLEALMIRRWLAAPTRFTAQIVVAPSYMFHYYWNAFPGWKARKDEDFYECKNYWHPAPGEECGTWGSRGFPLINNYWAQLKDKYYRPDEKYTPFVVVHQTFPWDRDNILPVEVLHARHPKFAKRVIFASLDGPNINTREQAKIPAELRLSNIITLPYTVGIVPPTQGFSVSAGTYNASRERPWALLFEGSIRNFWGVRPARAEIAKAVTQVASGLHAEKNPRAAFPANAARVTASKTVWFRSVYGRAMNSQFCLEPNGDTPTRSHTYVAILCGCVPVIFDHEAGGPGGANSSMMTAGFFDGEMPTVWPWRDFRGPVSLNYTDFAVVVDFRPIASGATTLAAVLKGVAAMPADEPARFLSLRQGLDRAARLMAYGLANTTGQDQTSSASADVFSTFAAWLEHRTAENAMRSDGTA